MKVIGVIPARYGSTRLTGKPLIQFHNKPLIQITYEAIVDSKLFDSIFIATESEVIKKTVMQFGANCIMTAKEAKNGTERCAELIKKINHDLNKDDIIINIQCDEPFIKKEHLKKLINLLKEKAEIGTIISPIKGDEINDTSVVKVTTSKDGYATSFYREESKLKTQKRLYKHIGVYGYRKNTLCSISNLSPTKGELLAKLEQLRWLENKYVIHCVFIKENLISINTIEDIKKVIKN
tara:strand:- start:20 stop:730 length:711 start_codon:yes stop_codon:yes gene_type:complete